MSTKTSRKKRLALELAASPTSINIMNMTSKSHTKKGKKHHQHGKWRSEGGCIYCKCGHRLYRGDLPKDQSERKDIADFIHAAEKYVKDLAKKVKVETRDNPGAHSTI